MDLKKRLRHNRYSENTDGALVIELLSFIKISINKILLDLIAIKLRKTNKR